MRTILVPTAAVLLLLAGCGEEDPAERPALVTASGLADVEWAKDLSCGTGFGAADEDDRIALVLHVDPDEGEQLTRTVTLPHPAWDGEIRTGTHLTANWCSDVVTEPEAEVDEEWTVVAGTLRFLDPALPPTAPGEEPVEVTAELTGIVVESPDGERVEVGDARLHNRLWGFYAG